MTSYTEDNFPHTFYKQHYDHEQIMFIIIFLSHQNNKLHRRQLTCLPSSH